VEFAVLQVLRTFNMLGYKSILEEGKKKTYQNSRSHQTVLRQHKEVITLLIQLIPIRHFSSSSPMVSSLIESSVSPTLRTTAAKIWWEPEFSCALYLKNPHNTDPLKRALSFGPKIVTLGLAAVWWKYCEGLFQGEKSKVKTLHRVLTQLPAGGNKDVMQPTAIMKKAKHPSPFLKNDSFLSSKKRSRNRHHQIGNVKKAKSKLDRMRKMLEGECDF